jgi:phage-related protein
LAASGLNARFRDYNAASYRQSSAAMPFSFQIDHHANLIRETWTGTVDIEQLRESCRQEWAHPEYRPGMPMISDFRDAEAILSADEVLQFASWFSDEDKPSKHAIVVSRELGLDMAGMYTLISDAAPGGDSSTQIFFSYAAAESWVLGSEPLRIQA